MAILELRAMRGWSKAETARRFMVTADTIRLWHQRVDHAVRVNACIRIRYLLAWRVFACALSCAVADYFYRTWVAD